MLTALEDILLDQEPDWVLVYGDTNSTIAGALAAVKLHLRVAHLEAGLRSFNRRMPEEHNRVLTDHASDLLLAPTQSALTHLASEGLSDRAVLVGDVMVDVCLRTAASVANLSVSSLHPSLQSGQYVAATLHRAENTDNPLRLNDIVAALKALPLPVVLPVHPRLRDRAKAAGISLQGGSLVPISPLTYYDMVLLVANARSVVTDSGGLQKEAFVLRTPCVTIRHETEWPETLEGGWNVLCHDEARLETMSMRSTPGKEPSAPFGSGDAAGSVARALTSGRV
jgi:UDP-N-acetylglucosamine 2-epimerase (non-hydrolysing)